MELVQWGGGEYNGYGGVEATCLLSGPETEYTSELSLVGRNRGRHRLTMYNYRNCNLGNIEDTSALLEICSSSREEEGYVNLQWPGGQVFACHIWMNATLLHTPVQED